MSVTINSGTPGSLKHKWNWHSREEWAVQQTTLHDGDDEAARPGWAIGLYASPAEVEQLIVELKAAYKAAGRVMKDKGRVSEDGGEAWYERREINDCLKQIRSGTLPWRHVFGGSALLDELLARRNKQADANLEAAKARKAQNPVDDEAWERELALRARFEGLKET